MFNVIYYFKGRRNSGLLDKADHHLLVKGQPKPTIDAHGGWYDASGDYGKHLSHLAEYTKAPGGIVKGITSGVTDKANFDFNLTYLQTVKDNDWRWAKQWLRHAAWYLLQVAAAG